jgi:hypothetical protein
LTEAKIRQSEFEVQFERRCREQFGPKHGRKPPEFQILYRPKPHGTPGDVTLLTSPIPEGIWLTYNPVKVYKEVSQWVLNRLPQHAGPESRFTTTPKHLTSFVELFTNLADKQFEAVIRFLSQLPTTDPASDPVLYRLTRGK